MRFLTAYFAIQPHREIVLTGSKECKNAHKTFGRGIEQFGS